MGREIASVTASALALLALAGTGLYNFASLQFCYRTNSNLSPFRKFHKCLCFQLSQLAWTTRSFAERIFHTVNKEDWKYRTISVASGQHFRKGQ